MSEQPVEVTQADAWHRFELWLFRECNEGTRRHLWSMFGLPIEEISNHGIERHALKYIKRCLATRPTPPADSDTNERFLSAYVSKDTRVIGIDHPTEAAWVDVHAAHVALRDRLNERLKDKDLCPHKPSEAPSSDMVEAMGLSENGVRKNLRDRLGSGSWPPKGV